MTQSPGIFVGTAGWAIRREHQHLYDPGPSHLARYATQFSGVEINSSFYRPHRAATYTKWATAVPAGFRFAVKMPRAITHDARLSGVEDALQKFLSECTALGDRLGPLLIQLPPSLIFDSATATRILTALRAMSGATAILEPRHPSWFGARCEAVDPVPAGAESAADPGGDTSVIYFRLHGAPKIYYSGYSDIYLRALAARLRAGRRAGSQVWCIFDNTALGHATDNARTLQDILEHNAA